MFCVEHISVLLASEQSSSYNVCVCVCLHACVCVCVHVCVCVCVRHFGVKNILERDKIILNAVLEICRASLFVFVLVF